VTLFPNGQTDKATYTAIDGDISDFFDISADLAKDFRTDRLRGYLMASGHPDPEVRDALLKWQEHMFQRVNSSWETFKLTPAGQAAVRELRARLD
jgi:hypothetical protein